MLIRTAISLFKTPESIASPYSVKTYCKYFRCTPLPFSKVTVCDLKELSLEVAICDLKESNSESVNLNINSSGNRPIFLFTAWFNAFTGTLYNSAKSLSSITYNPLIKYILFLISSSFKIISSFSIIQISTFIDVNIFKFHLTFHLHYIRKYKLKIFYHLLKHLLIFQLLHL